MGLGYRYLFCGGNFASVGGISTFSKSPFCSGVHVAWGKSIGHSPPTLFAGSVMVSSSSTTLALLTNI